MKKIYLVLLILLSGFQVFSQVVAIDDTVFVDMGEVVQFNPINNDSILDGDILKIIDVTVPNSFELISFNDTSITFKVAEYYIGEYKNVRYELESEANNSDAHGAIKVIINDANLMIDTLGINQISTPIYPQNIQFWDAYTQQYGKAQYRYPKESNTTTIFNMALWIGGLDINDQVHFAGERYRQNGSDFWSGPLSADGNASSDSAVAGQWFRTWKVNRVEINDHIAHFNDNNYEMPEAIENWPAHGDHVLEQAEYIAPFVDVDQDLEYHPEQGDYPLIKGDETIFFVFNDQLVHTETGGTALGIEIHCMAWGFNKENEDNPYNSTIFLNYKIFNKSNETYFDTYLGVFSDLDLGNPEDDYIGCHVENGNYFIYNGDDYDEDISIYVDTIFGYHSDIPSQGICMLGGPYIDEDNLDNPIGQCDEGVNGVGFGDGEIDNERHGMSRFSYFASNGPSYTQDPQIALEYYDVMGGIENDSLYPYRFMLPGDSDSCHWGTDGLDPGYLWTEETTGNQPGNRRGVASMGPFTFEAGSVEFIDIALVTAPGDQEKNSQDLLQDYVKSIRTDYLKDPMGFGNQHVGIEDGIKKESLLEVYPNPINGNLVHFVLPQANKVSYKIYNTAGQLVQEAALEAQENQSIQVGNLISGWYILEVNADGKIFRSKLIK